MDMIKLPMAEFELMKIIWDEQPPVPSHRIMERLAGQKDWKPQTALTLLSRLTGRGFLQSAKQGRERNYSPLVGRDEYLAFESEQFLSTFHQGSLSSLVAALYPGKKLSEEDARELSDWLKERL